MTNKILFKLNKFILNSFTVDSIMRAILFVRAFLLQYFITLFKSLLQLLIIASSI